MTHSLLAARLMRALAATLALACSGLGAQTQAAAGGDIEAALDVTLGDSFQALATRLKGRLEPDLCDSETYARALGWSCEGYQARGLSAAGVPMRARFSLDASGAVVRSIAVILDAQADTAARSDAAVVRACAHLMRSIQARYTDTPGVGHQAQSEARFVQHYESRDRRAVATLLCAKGTGSSLGEVALVIDPSENGRAGGLRSAVDVDLSPDHQLQRSQGIAGERGGQTPVALTLGQVLAQKVPPGCVDLGAVSVVGLPGAPAFG